ncbi:MAG TPA: hypothetical protein VFG14_17805, partial [Chthoniobacteraceae bacterium]|nr:hypothetical protein [Chthoniobacteraceae bacterium]
SEPVVFLNLPAEEALASGTALRLTSIQIQAPSGHTVQLATSASVSPSVIFEWSGPPGTIIKLEASPDLRNWSEVTLEMLPTRDGQFRGQASGSDTSYLFYRLNLVHSVSR